MRTTLLVTAPRGSGGAYSHLSNVLPRLVRRLTECDIELCAPRDVLRSCFGRDDEPWMRPLAEAAAYGQRARWEFVELPRRLRADPHAILWSPFGPPLNLALAPHTVWISQNIIPLIPTAEWELAPSDHLRLRAVRGLVATWARRARRIICISHHARERLAALAGIPSADVPVIPHGIDPPRLGAKCSTPEFEQLRKTRYVLHLGQPTPYRRTREMIEAYARASARTADVPRLVIAGKARAADLAYERACMDAAAPMIAAGRLLWLGQLAHHDALALMASALVFAYPSVQEDCPNVVLEALAAGRVSVFSDIPAVRELADDAAVYSGSSDVETLCRALERALGDEALRDRLSRRARERAAQFTWDRTAERTAQVLAMEASRAAC